MANQSIYTVGGTVQAGGGVYIPRKADEELLTLCRASEFAFILSSRQVGKSSLMVRTARQLEGEGISSVIVDLSSIGVNISADEWYLGILNEVANALELRADIFGWWAERAALSPATRMTNFFREVLLKEVTQPVVLFFDEIDTTLSIPFKDDFFTALRAIYNARSNVTDFKRLSFVLIGVASPSDLISDSARTPFNIGRRVELTDFTREELNPLAEGLGENAAQVLEWAFDWTNGHPYLTQRLCAYLGRSGLKSDLRQETVESAVKDLFLGEKGMEDNNLQFVRDMLLERAADKTGVLKIYQQALNSKKPVEDDEQSLNKSHLKLAGVVRRRQVNLRVSNLIYQYVFNSNWVREHLPYNDRSMVIVMLSMVTILAMLLAVLGATGLLRQIIYRPLETEWANVPAGEFTMGSTFEQIEQEVISCQEVDTCTVDMFVDELPVHSVYLSAYQIMRYEVTNKQYTQCVKSGICEGQDTAGNILPHLTEKAYADHPVVYINFFQAKTYCQWIGARLPTEAEWEKAARGVDSRIYPWGDDFNGNVVNFCDMKCWHYWANKNFDDGFVETSPVGSYPDGVSPYGVYDMAGNVWEWTASSYDVYPGGISNQYQYDQTNQDASMYQVIRGGAWDVYSSIVRTTNRGRNLSQNPVSTLGFRCVRDLLPSQVVEEFGKDVATKFALTAKPYIATTVFAPKNPLTATAFCQPLATSTPTSISAILTPTVENPMAMIEEFARQTSVAQTVTVFSQVCQPVVTPTSTLAPSLTSTPTP